jgi:ethanolamine transporter EutH
MDHQDIPRVIFCALLFMGEWFVTQIILGPTLFAHFMAIVMVFSVIPRDWGDEGKEYTQP